MRTWASMFDYDNLGLTFEAKMVEIAHRLVGMIQKSEAL
jgi:hypothetical protein